MRNRWSLVSSRVGLAVVGAVVVGGISAAIATGPTLLRGTARADSAQSPIAAAPSAEATPGATADATASPGQSATAVDNPDATATAPMPTPTPMPTRTPRPTPPPGPTATPLPSVQGTVVSTSPTFVLQPNTGPAVTVAVDAGTRFDGCAQSLSTLVIGWHVRATGTYQTDGTFLASTVNSDGNCLDT